MAPAQPASPHAARPDWPALLVVNRRSRQGADAAGLVRDAFAEAGLPVREAEAKSAADLGRLIKEAAHEVGRVVLGGGDGTLNAALPALLETKLPLGIVPLGTGNDLARTLGVPTDATLAARVIVAGKRRAIDIGEANDHPFFNVASIGFGVDLTRALTADAKKRWGVFGYPVAGLRALGRMRSFTVEIEVDGAVQRGRTVHLAVGNGRHYGGGMTVSEQAAIDDGRLNIYSLEVRSFWRLMMLLPALREGTHGRWSEVRTLSGSAFTVRTHRPRSVNTDGEITTRTPVVFGVRPAALEVFVP